MPCLTAPPHRRGQGSAAEASRNGSGGVRPPPSPHPPLASSTVARQRRLGPAGGSTPRDHTATAAAGRSCVVGADEEGGAGNARSEQERREGGRWCGVSVATSPAPGWEGSERRPGAARGRGGVCCRFPARHPKNRLGRLHGRRRLAGGAAHGGSRAAAAAGQPGVGRCPQRRTPASRRAARVTRRPPALPPADAEQRPPPPPLPARCHDQQSGRPARSVSLRPPQRLLAVPLCVGGAPTAADSGLGGGPCPPPVLTRSLSRRREDPRVRQPLQRMSRRRAPLVAAAILSALAEWCAGGLPDGGGPHRRCGLGPVHAAAARLARCGGNNRTQGCPLRQGGKAPPGTSVRGELFDPSLPSSHPRYGTGQYGPVAMAAADARRALNAVSTRHTPSPSARGLVTASPRPARNTVGRNDKYG